VEVNFYSTYTLSWCGQRQVYRYTFHRSIQTTEQSLKHGIFNVGLPSISFDAVLASCLFGSPAEMSLHRCKADPSFK